MTRFHPFIGPVSQPYHWPHNEWPAKFLVTSRRKPRGYIVRAKESRMRSETRGNWYARSWCEVVEGWRPVGFNGHRGEVQPTMKAAAHALLMDHRFDAPPTPDLAAPSVL